MNGFSIDRKEPRCWFCDKIIEGEIATLTPNSRELSLHPDCLPKHEANLAKEAAEREQCRVNAIRSYSLGSDLYGGGLSMVPVLAWRWAAVGSPLFKQRVRPKFCAFAKTFTFDRSAVLLGGTGTGKTSSVRAALVARAVSWEREAIAVADMPPEKHAGLRALHGLRWHSGSEVALARKQFALGKGDAKLVESAIHSTILVVDECGFETPDGALFDIVNERYMRERPTVITTGLTVEGFKTRYGDAMWRRLTERGLKVEDFGE